MNLILKVTAPDERVTLQRLLEAPLGLDVWEVKPDHTVLRASDAQAERLQRMGYAVEQLHETATYISSFAATSTTAAYHTVATMEQDLRALAASRPEIVELHQIGSSLEGRPIWALCIGQRSGSARKLLFLGCHHAREWISVEMPYLLANYLVQNANH